MRPLIEELGGRVVEAFMTMERLGRCGGREAGELNYLPPAAQEPALAT